jgi:hypothetical protein
MSNLQSSVYYSKRLSAIALLISSSTLFMSGCAATGDISKDCCTTSGCICTTPPEDYDTLVRTYIQTHYNALPILDQEVPETLKNVEISDHPVCVRGGYEVTATFDCLNTRNLDLDHGGTYDIYHFTVRFYIHGGEIVSVRPTHTMQVVVRDELTW